MTVRGYVDEISARGIIGWAVDQADLDRTVEVVILVNGQEYGRVAADRSRPGLGDALGLAVSDQHGLEFSFTPPLSAWQDTAVVILNAADGRPLENGRRILRGLPQRSSTLMPLLVTSRGRSGSTVFMSELARQAEIVVADIYPFEVKLASYYTAVLRVLSGMRFEDDVDFAENAEASLLIGGNPWNRPHVLQAIGGRQLERLFGDSIPGRLNDQFRQIVLDSYGVIGVERGKDAPRYFAEKSPVNPDIRRGIRAMFGEVREILLVRDPRDYLCSARAFWHMETDQVLAGMEHDFAALEAAHATADPDVWLVRYEDLIQRPAATWQGIHDFLGLPPRTGEPQPTRFADHTTTDSPAASIGRWQRELTPAEQQACESRFASYLVRFGYSTRARQAA